MTPSQFKALKQSYISMQPFVQEFGEVFYTRLFVIDPALRKMFRGDLKAQHAKFMKVVAEIVKLRIHSFPVTETENAEAAIPGAYWGGMLHGGFGCTHADFVTMGNALIWALANTPSFSLTEEELGAWRFAYDTLARAMKDGLQGWYDELEAEKPEMHWQGSTDESAATASLVRIMTDRSNNFSSTEEAAASRLREELNRQQLDSDSG